MSEEDINIIEDFLNYNKEKYLSGVEISSISQLLKAYKKQQKEIKDCKIKYIYLKGDYQLLLDDMKDHKVVYIDTPEFEEKFISKDKIIEIIEHYNNELEHIKNGEEFENEKPMYYWGKVALENLLGEN